MILYGIIIHACFSPLSMLVCIRPDNIKYRAEGNAGIVVSLIEEGTVLRLKKQDNACKNNSTTSDALQELESEIKVINNVWKLILGESYVNTPLLVLLKGEEIKILNAAISKFRPTHRMHKNVKEIDMYVFMLPDYCSLPRSLMCMPTCGPVLCIEIKLKQGFVKEQYLPSSIQPSPLLICNYCMMQRYKLKIGKISSRSKYCPSDLFSGCQHRMLHALKMLLETPQNNLRIFKDQNLVYSEEKKENLNELLTDFAPSEKIRPLNLLCDLLIQALVKPFPHGLDKTPVPFQKKFHENCANAFISHSKHDCCQELPKCCVLERIMSCQMLDDLKIAELHHLYLQIKGKNKHSNFIGCYSRSEIPPYIGEQRKNFNESQHEYASRKVWEFLVALTMKDCSVMITMQQLLPNCSIKEYSQNIILDKYENLYAISIAIADLDYKPSFKVEKVYNDFLSMLQLISIEHDFKYL